MSNEMDLNFGDLFSENTKLLMDDSPVIENEENEKEPEKQSSLKNETNDFFGKKEVELIHGTAPSDEKDDEEDDDEPIKEEPKEDEKNTPSSDDTEGASGSFALAFAKFQQDEGVISEINEEELNKVIEEEGEVGALRFLLEKQRDAIYEEAKSTYAADQAELREYFELKDSGVDAETAKKLAFDKKHFGSATEDDVEADEDFRKEVLMAHYKATTTFSDAKIKKMVENTFNLGEDVEDAKEALKELKVINEQQIAQAKKQVEEQEKQYKESIKTAQENFKKFVTEQEEFIKGIKINKPTRDKIIKMVLEPAAKDAQGNVLNGVWAERSKDPQKFDAYLAYHLTNGTFWGNLDKIKSKVKTDVTTQFEEALRVKGQSLGGKTTKTATKDTSVLDDFFKF